MGRLGDGKGNVFITVTDSCLKVRGVFRRVAAVTVHRAGRSGYVLLATFLCQ